MRLDLARQITIGLLVYGVLLSIALFAHGLLVNERAERRIWEAMLDTSMTDLLERRRHDPRFQWHNNGKLDLYVLDGDDGVPDVLRTLRPGLHDNVFFGANEWVVLVREEDGRRLALALDIDGFEAGEWDLVKPVIVSSVAFMLVLAITIHFGARLLAHPLRDMADRIGRLAPDRRGQRIRIPTRASSELEVIAGALNDYLERNERFVERERAFIDIASHELRTPVAVIRSAAHLAASVPGLPAQAALQIDRIGRTTRDMEELVSMLLVLAKDPARVRLTAEHVALDEMLPGIVEDHRHLCADKALELHVAPLPPCRILAPEAVVRVAVGNLLRNAIEHSDRGRILIGIEASQRVVIADPGHGMTPEEIGALYARLARGGVHGAGLGLALIARISEHLGWTLDIDSDPKRGTTVRLDFGSAVAG